MYSDMVLDGLSPLNGHGFNTEAQHMLHIQNLLGEYSPPLYMNDLILALDEAHCVKLNVGLGPYDRQLPAKDMLWKYCQIRMLEPYRAKLDPMLDLLSRLFQYDPKLRWSTTEALSHPVFNQEKTRSALFATIVPLRSQPNILDMISDSLFV